MHSFKEKGITSRNDFQERRKTDPELHRIPADLYKYYEGWSWNEAKGKPEFFETKEEAYALIQRKGITSRNDFQERRKTDPELHRILANLYKYYEGWSWKEAKGEVGFFEIKEEAYALIQRKGITSRNDFQERRKTDPELHRIPVKPYEHYEGWSWKEAKGESRFFLRQRRKLMN